jgi:esterase FrsA
VRRHTRPLAELWPLWKDRAAAGAHPFQFTLSHDVERVVTGLRSYDRDAWAAAFSAAAAPYRSDAEDAEQAGDIASARTNYLRAYGYYRLARYPTTNSEAKLAAYRQSQDMLLRASRCFTIPIERVEFPFHGRAGEGDRIVAYLRIPDSDGRLPILILSGGIDTFKEDIPRDGVLDRGIATLAVDIPGVGDAPLPGSPDAERMFDAVLDWIGRQPRFDAERVGYWGASTGGYWAVKIAHTHRDRLACVVSHGGCVHHAFEPEWIETAQWGEYPFELAETLAYAFGHNTFDEWLEYAPRLSLLRQGILDQPCTEILAVNGLHDSVFPISDCYLLLEHGMPKSARFFDAAHMGYTPDTDATIIDWIASRLAQQGGNKA